MFVPEILIASNNLSKFNQLTILFLPVVVPCSSPISPSLDKFGSSKSSSGN